MAINLKGSDTSTYSSGAAFAGSATTISSTGAIGVRNFFNEVNDATFACYAGRNFSGTTTSEIFANGSATFASAVTINDPTNSSGHFFGAGGGAEHTVASGTVGTTPVLSVIKGFGNSTFQVTADGDITTGSFDPSSATTNGIELGVAGACSAQRPGNTSSSAVLFRGLWGDNATTVITNKGDATFAGNVNAFNVQFALDPNDPTKVLDVKESIRTVQSALYRLKAAVLIPDQTVNDLRLKILEALENISEVDE